jgi:hypothetical protein
MLVPGTQEISSIYIEEAREAKGCDHIADRWVRGARGANSIVQGENVIACDKSDMSDVTIHHDVMRIHTYPIGRLDRHWIKLLLRPGQSQTRQTHQTCKAH